MNSVRLLVLGLVFGVGTANAQCRLCAPDADAPVTAQPTRPLTIEVTTALDMGRAAATGAGGSIRLDERSGTRSVEGLRDLGGYTITGTVRLTGEPMRRVRVTLPVSVLLTSVDGAIAEAAELRTDLPGDPVLDGAGVLSFAFGGRLIVRGDAAGDFRGRISITADYE